MGTRELCGAKTRRGTSCIRKARSNGRCPNHGGCSTGPRTPEGKAKIGAAQRNRWARWREEQPQRLSDRELSDTAVAPPHHGVLEFCDARAAMPNPKITPSSDAPKEHLRSAPVRHGVQPDRPMITLSPPRQPDSSPVTTWGGAERWVRPQVQVCYAGKKRR